MALRSPRSVGFTFIHGGKDWHGSLNYFRSLFLALQTLPAGAVEPVGFFGKGVDPAEYGFPPNLRVVQDRVFDRLSVKWALNKLAQRLTGVPAVANRTVLGRGVRVHSHGAPTHSRRLPAIAWIPDFQHMHLPQFFPPEELALRDRQYMQLVRDSDLVVVSSEAARADLERFAPQHAAKARVLRFVAIRPQVDLDAVARVTAAHGLDGPYFYMPNQVWAHKNHLVAIRALGELATRRSDVRIVCSGSLSDYRNPKHLETLRAEIARLGLEQRFVLLGLVPYDHIAPLMMGAVAVINPSLFEGWSTTVEEAKALGVPLLLSGIDVHREQCQLGEGRFFDPSDPAALASLMEAQLAGWRGAGARDPSAALAAHRVRTEEFARTYERIVAELAP